MEAAITQYQQARAALVDALQLEYFCDDLEPPPAALGWDADALVTFYKSGGTDVPTPVAPLATPAVPAEVVDGPDPALMQFLDETDGFAHLRSALSAISWDECESLYQEGRPKLLSRLGKLGVGLSEY